jgi:hypothetical protein
MATVHSLFLERKVDALYAILRDPQPDDIDWCDELLTRLEEVAEHSLQPGIPVHAQSRTLQDPAEAMLSIA